MHVIARASALALPFPSDYFHAAITSPPYYALRDYHGEQAVTFPAGAFIPMAGLPEISYPAWTGELGDEPTLEMYVGHIVAIGDEVWRALRRDGVFWLNISDTYSGSGGAGGDYNEGGNREGQPKWSGRSEEALQPGDTMGVPWRVAFALQARGWILRSDVIWRKDSMPEPRFGWFVSDRPCSCVRERRERHIRRQMDEQGVARHRIYDKAGTKFVPDPACPDCRGRGYHGPKKLHRHSWRHTRSHEHVFMFTKQMGYFSNHFKAKRFSGGSNPKDVVTAMRENYSGEHFAVYPPDLIMPLIQTTVPKKTCGVCGSPLAPVVEKRINKNGDREEKIVGWRNVCIHKSDSGRGRVLDPFLGSGTTGMVANTAGVDWAGVDISHEYLRDQALRRALGRLPTSAEQYDELPLFTGRPIHDSS